MPRWPAGRPGHSCLRCYTGLDTLMRATSRLFPPCIVAACTALILLLPLVGVPQASSSAQVLKAVDASVTRREAGLVGYTAIEHYAVFRSSDAVHPAAEMTVRATYRSTSGKSYEILSESGSQFLRKAVLERTLQNERDLTKPAERVRALIDTGNYKMQVASNATLDDRPCIVLQISPRRAASYLFTGQIWVDSRDGTIVQLKGTTAKPVSILTGRTQVARNYTLVDGYPMATRATATTSVAVIGQIRMVIDYSDYHLQFAPQPAHAQTVTAR